MASKRVFETRASYKGDAKTMEVLNKMFADLVENVPEIRRLGLEKVFVTQTTFDDMSLVIKTKG